MLWVIIANTSTCRIYEYNSTDKALTLFKAMVHPESKLKGSDLVSDKQGNYIARDSAHGSYSPHENVKAVEIESFARDISNELESGKNQNLYQQIYLFAAPHMHGSIKHQLSSHVKNLIKKDINKDYSHLTEEDLLERIREAMLPS